FAGDEDELPSAANRRLEQLLKARQLGFAPHQRLRSAGILRACRRHPARRPDGADEAEPTPVDRLDVPRRTRRTRQRAAALAEAAREGGLAPDRVAPDGDEQVVLAEEPLGSLDAQASH